MVSGNQLKLRCFQKGMNELKSKFINDYQIVGIYFFDHTFTIFTLK
jgi:hypothetical protein